MRAPALHVHFHLSICLSIIQSYNQSYNQSIILSIYLSLSFHLLFLSFLVFFFCFLLFSQFLFVFVFLFPLLFLRGRIQRREAPLGTTPGAGAPRTLMLIRVSPTIYYQCPVIHTSTGKSVMTENIQENYSDRHKRQQCKRLYITQPTYSIRCHRIFW